MPLRVSKYERRQSRSLRGYHYASILRGAYCTGCAKDKCYPSLNSALRDRHDGRNGGGTVERTYQIYSRTRASPAASPPTNGIAARASAAAVRTSSAEKPRLSSDGRSCPTASCTPTVELRPCCP